MRNLSFSQILSLIYIPVGIPPVVIQGLHWYCRISDNSKCLVEPTDGYGRIIFVNSVIDTNVNIIYNYVLGFTIEFIDSIVQCDTFSRSDSVPVIYRRINCPVFTGTINDRAILNYQNVTLTGATPVNVVFPDAKAGDSLDVTIITEAGTPGPIRVQLVPGTGATITGTAGDTSIVQVSFK
jgi:hypothetical protein